MGLSIKDAMRPQSYFGNHNLDEKRFERFLRRIVAVQYYQVSDIQGMAVQVLNGQQPTSRTGTPIEF